MMIFTNKNELAKFIICGRPECHLVYQLAFFYLISTLRDVSVEALTHCMAINIEINTLAIIILIIDRGWKYAMNGLD